METRYFSKISDFEAEDTEKKKTRLVSSGALFLILFLVFSLSLTVSLISERTSLFGRAQTSRSQGKLSAENSYVFASPLSATANGKEKIRITVFLLDTEGLGVQEKRVYLGQTTALAIQEIQAITDSSGKALFDVSSTKKGEYLVEVGVEKSILPQRARITFR